MEKKYLVAFIDILGFRNLVDNYFNGKNPTSLPVLKKALKDAEDYSIKFNRAYLKRLNIKVSFKQFSDCVSISTPFKEEDNLNVFTTFSAFIDVIRSYQFILLYHEIFVRGGISVGRHFENSNMIFSEALIKSYNIETKKAINPRIIIDREIIQILEKSMLRQRAQLTDFLDLYEDALVVDWDDEVFVSPFGLFKQLEKIKKKMGKEVIDEALLIGIKSLNLKDEIPPDLIIGSEDDKVFAEEILSLVNNTIENNESNLSAEIILKHKWMAEFINWYIEPGRSKIKFKKYFSS